MKSIFEPLLHANARAFAILGGVLFLAMLGWSVYAEYSASRQSAANEEEASHAAQVPAFPAHESLGILAYVESQTAPGGESSHLPVDLFRPPVDDEGNPVRPGTTLHLQKQEESGDSSAEGGEEVPTEVAQLIEEAQKKLGKGDGGGGKGGGGGWRPGGSRPGTPGTPDRTLRYAGVFKRSDGTLAAWVSDSAGGGSFVTPGTEIAGSTILDGSDMERVRLRLADGTEATLERGGEPVVVEHGQPARQAVGNEGGGNGGGRPRRMPTEAEIAEIEKRDPELARRIREAIKKHKKP